MANSCLSKHKDQTGSGKQAARAGASKPMHADMDAISADAPPYMPESSKALRLNGQNSGFAQPTYRFPTHPNDLINIRNWDTFTQPSNRPSGSHLTTVTGPGYAGSYPGCTNHT